MVDIIAKSSTCSRIRVAYESVTSTCLARLCPQAVAETAWAAVSAHSAFMHDWGLVLPADPARWQVSAVLMPPHARSPMRYAALRNLSPADLHKPCRPC